MKYIHFLTLGLLLLGIVTANAEQVQPAYPTKKQHGNTTTTTIQQDNATVTVTTQVGPQSPH